MKMSKVYTRTGDHGKTSLVGGERVDKASTRLEAYGTVDELNAHLGLLLAEMEECEERLEVERIQNTLFHVGCHLATDQTKAPAKGAALLPEGEEVWLENAIDRLTVEQPTLTGFILPGGTRAAAQAHVCRTVCRRAERCVFALMAETVVAPQMAVYLNRLSDYLFVLSRKLNFIKGTDEKIWHNACK